MNIKSQNRLEFKAQCDFFIILTLFRSWINFSQFKCLNILYHKSKLIFSSYYVRSPWNWTICCGRMRSPVHKFSNYLGYLINGFYGRKKKRYKKSHYIHKMWLLHQTTTLNFCIHNDVYSFSRISTHTLSSVKVFN